MLILYFVFYINNHLVENEGQYCILIYLKIIPLNEKFLDNNAVK